MTTRELIQSMADFFEKEEIQYALIGAFALYGYGYVRATRDVDFLIQLEDREKVILFLEKLGFETLSRSNAFSNHLHPLAVARVDLMYVKGKTAEELFGAARRLVILGCIEVPVVCPEHLIALKLFAAKSNPERKFKELADVKEILSRAAVDREAVRRYFDAYGLEPYTEEILGE